MLDGYQTVFGEMVEGDAVLAEMEAATDRHGAVSKDFKIVEAGMLWISSFGIIDWWDNLV